MQISIIVSERLEDLNEVLNPTRLRISSEVCISEVEIMQTNLDPKDLLWEKYSEARKKVADEMLRQAGLTS